MTSGTELWRPKFWTFFTFKMTSLKYAVNKVVLQKPKGNVSASVDLAILLRDRLESKHSPQIIHIPPCFKPWTWSSSETFVFFKNYLKQKLVWRIKLNSKLTYELKFVLLRFEWWWMRILVHFAASLLHIFCLYPPSAQLLCKATLNKLYLFRKRVFS